MEYDLVESMKKESRDLMISFVKRIFQAALPVSMTLVYNSRLNDEQQLLIADTNMKFKLFDKNTFEILATFLGPIYDSYVKQFVSIYRTELEPKWIFFFRNFGLKVPLSFLPRPLLIEFLVFVFYLHSGCKLHVGSHGSLKVFRLRYKQKHLSPFDAHRWESVQEFGHSRTL